MTYPQGRIRLRQKVVECPRCRKKYLVNLATMAYHQTCEITNFGAKWK